MMTHTLARRGAAATVAAALVVAGLAGPALAKNKHKKVDEGDVIAGAALAGILGLAVGAAVASSNSSAVYVDPAVGPAYVPDSYDPAFVADARRTYNRCTRYAVDFFSRRTGKPTELYRVGNVKYLGGDRMELRGRVVARLPNGPHQIRFTCRTRAGEVFKFQEG
jgi:hypothetical protein